MRSTDGVQDQASTIQKSKKKASNINVQAAFIHVIGDLCQSVGVLVAAFIIYFKVRHLTAENYVNNSIQYNMSLSASVHNRIRNVYLLGALGNKLNQT